MLRIGETKTRQGEVLDQGKRWASSVTLRAACMGGLPNHRTCAALASHVLVSSRPGIKERRGKGKPLGSKQRRGEQEEGVIALQRRPSLLPSSGACNATHAFPWSMTTTGRHLACGWWGGCAVCGVAREGNKAFLCIQDFQSLASSNDFSGGP